MDIKKSQQDLTSTDKNVENSSLDRRDFFRKTAALSVTALAGTSLLASEEAGDPAILKPTEWGQNGEILLRKTFMVCRQNMSIM